MKAAIFGRAESRYLSGIIDRNRFAVIAPESTEVSDDPILPPEGANRAIGSVAPAHHLSGLVYGYGDGLCAAEAPEIRHAAPALPDEGCFQARPAGANHLSCIVHGKSETIGVARQGSQVSHDTVSPQEGTKNRPGKGVAPPHNISCFVDVERITHRATEGAKIPHFVVLPQEGVR
jgi:hypothetical protein